MNEILALLTRHGEAVVFVAAFLEQIGAPIPAIPVIVVAGAVAATTGGGVASLLVLAVAGALLADVVWYVLGRRYGYRILGLLCRVSLSPDSCVRKTETFFDRWGYLSLAFAKFVPGYSVVAPPLAGALPRASFPRFLLYDAVGAVLWAGASLAAGVLLHDAIEDVLEALEALGGWAVVLLASALVLFVLFKWWERRRFYRTLQLARISPAELRERLTSGPAVVVLDVRSPSAQRHDPRSVPGARMASEDRIEIALRDVDPAQEIVLYCT
ncbi:MAG: VTT domain-containing protein [Thermoanaerobaculia bacterium]